VRRLFSTLAIASLLGAFAIDQTAYAADEVGHAPSIAISYADKQGAKIPATATRFIAFKSAFSALREGKPAQWRRLVGQLPGVNLRQFGSNGGEIPFGEEQFVAMAKSCRGPFFLEESHDWPSAGQDWVNVSWVCYTDEAAPLSTFYRFHDTPELTAIIDFRGDSASSFFFSELLLVPEQRVFPMDVLGSYREPVSD